MTATDNDLTPDAESATDEFDNAFETFANHVAEGKSASGIDFDSTTWSFIEQRLKNRRAQAINALVYHRDQNVDELRGKVYLCNEILNLAKRHNRHG